MQEPTKKNEVQGSTALVNVRRKLRMVSALALMTFAIVNLVVVLRDSR